MLEEFVLSVIRKYPEGIWIRDIARKARVSPATVCNYLYGYRDSSGKFVKPVLKEFVVLEKFGNGSLTIVKPRDKM